MNAGRVNASGSSVDGSFQQQQQQQRGSNGETSFRRSQNAGAPGPARRQQRQSSESSFHSRGSSPTLTRQGSQQQAVGRFNDWLEVYSPEHGRVFFYNKVTRESQWTDPRLDATTASSSSPSRAPGTANRTSTNSFASAWENVSLDSSSFSPSSNTAATTTQKPPPTTPIAVASSDEPPAASSATRGGGASTGLPPSPVKTTTAPAATSWPASGGGDLFGEQLEMFAKDLQRNSEAVRKHENLLSPEERKEAEKMYADANDFARTAEAMLAAGAGAGGGGSSKGDKKSRGMKRTLTDTDYALANWGNEPPKVLEVKRAMRTLEEGMKYAKEELEAQGKAAKEAEKVDSEGGYYSILGVPTNADLDTLKKAYRKGMIRCHPDKVPEAEKAQAMDRANMLQNAFNCLSDPWERYNYDYFGMKKYLQNLKVIECFKNFLLSGISIVKHPRKGLPRTRSLWISPDKQWINTGERRILEPSDKEQESIKGVKIADIFDITQGIATSVLARTGKPSKHNRYLSLITPQRTLDIELETPQRCDFLFSRLSFLVLDTQKNAKWLQRFHELKALKDAMNAFRNGPPKPPPNPPANGGSNNNKSRNGSSEAGGGGGAQEQKEPEIPV